MLSKNDLSFSYKNLRKSYLADLQKTYENLTMNLEKSYEVSRIGAQVPLVVFYSSVDWMLM